jgi:hypothetical protein
MKNKMLAARGRFARIAIPALALASVGVARADDAATPVVTAINGLSGPVSGIITAALVIGMLVIGATLAYGVAKKFLH